MYRTMKALNNNGVLALNVKSGKEVIMLGNGIGFGKRDGDLFEKPDQARMYEMVTKKVSILELLNELDPRYLEITARIIEESKMTLGEMKHTMLLPMADHIAMAVKRAVERKELPNPLRRDIQILFAEEYQAAKRGQVIIEEMTGVKISEDEVGYITLHIHSGRSDERVTEVMSIAMLVQDSVKKIEEGMGVELDPESLGYNRLVSHLRYMIGRVKKNEPVGLDLEDYAKSRFPDAYALASRICREMEQELRMKIPQVETGFLAIHILRVTRPSVLE